MQKNLDPDCSYTLTNGTEYKSRQFRKLKCDFKYKNKRGSSIGSDIRRRSHHFFQFSAIYFEEILRKLKWDSLELKISLLIIDIFGFSSILLNTFSMLYMPYTTDESLREKSKTSTTLTRFS